MLQKSTNWHKLCDRFPPTVPLTFSFCYFWPAGWLAGWSRPNQVKNVCSAVVGCAKWSFPVPNKRATGFWLWFWFRIGSGSGLGSRSYSGSQSGFEVTCWLAARPALIASLARLRGKYSTLAPNQFRAAFVLC